MKEQDINNFLNQIENIKFINRESENQLLEKLENKITLGEIESCFFSCFGSNYLLKENLNLLKENLTKLLANRWQRIRGTRHSYNNSPNDPINQLCLELAKKISPIPDTEDEINELEHGQGPYFLLMPSLKASMDIYQDNIHNLALHQFILTDDQAIFIPIEDCLNLFSESDHGALTHTVTAQDGDGTYNQLSQAETQRVIHHSTLPIPQ